MAPRTLPGLGLSGYAPFGETNWNTWTDVNWRTLSALARLTVLDVINALPGAPSDGDIYIMSESAGVSPNTIAVRDNGAWVHIPAVQGWTAYNRATARLLRFSGTLWREVLEDYSATQGTVLFRGAAGWQALAPGTAGQFLQTNGAGANPAWADGSDTSRVAIAGDTMTGALQVPAGTAGAPGLQVGAADTGLFQAAGKLGFAVGGTEVGAFYAAGLGINVVATQPIHVYGTVSYQALFESDAEVDIVVARFSADTAAPSFRGHKGRGTKAAPGQVLAGDTVFQLSGRGYDNGGTPAVRRVGQVVITAASNVTPTSAEGQVRLMASASGSISPTEVVRADVAAGLSMFGANTVIDGNRLLTNRTATLAGLLTGAAGKQQYVSDLGGGGGILHHDGAQWRRTSDGGYQTVSTDATFTLTPLTSPEQTRHTGTLTANRAVTLSTSNAYPGARFRITRTGGGGFTLDVGTGPLKSLATNTWADFVYDGSAWYLSAYGAL